MISSFIPKYFQTILNLGHIYNFSKDPYTWLGYIKGLGLIMSDNMNDRNTLENDDLPLNSTFYLPG